MNKLLRILKHRWLDASDARRALGPASVARIEARIKASESTHSGEIRVCVEAGLPLSYLWRNASPRERAVSIFGKLRVWDTESNNGVLIYLLLAEHRIEILADRGLNTRVPADTWKALASQMSDAFKAGRFEDGLAAAIDAVDGLLVQHFPLKPGERNPNELPDHPAFITG
jgi:uncharacterized membrane protein